MTSKKAQNGQGNNTKKGGPALLLPLSLSTKSSIWNYIGGKLFISKSLFVNTYLQINTFLILEVHFQNRYESEL